MSAKPIRKRGQAKWKAHPHFCWMRTCDKQWSLLLLLPPPPLPLHNCKLSTRWLTFGRRLWPRVKTLFSFQLSRRRQNNCHVQANTININMYRTCIHHGVYVCACIYCFLINQTKSERGGTQRRRSRFVVPARGKVGRGHLFILFTVIENGAALLANKIW